jgi:hypothetical protein
VIVALLAVAGVAVYAGGQYLIAKHGARWAAEQRD